MPQYITTHNSSGQAIFSTTVPEEPHRISMRPNDPSDPSDLTILYTSHAFKADLSGESDIQQYSHDRTNGLPPGQICPTNGWGVNIVTLGPGKSPNHRTMTLDVVYILEGEIELTLDSGEQRIVRKGDSIVQRGTMHQWRNVTPDNGVARLLGVAVASEEPVKVGEKELGTEWHFE
ncbi:hypothetical protein M409DRAFT_30704 [Zasmidium cellare ATCC 36951]|uniref:Cupin type-2 domain-containing protein n=1 Tax=Zasmidium cellare ATCC 36951 TaxID=1080233 RepID=A0A6A6BZ17_ZASCE|nr:uncharacterized protein M409DRAFT_30704 [Zasmidium cellare ATCC 36951]KAF2158832.1 hypothetical protein M409DRAFT_30704 [Zasmidium cellare ATCC 36951]